MNKKMHGYVGGVLLIVGGGMMNKFVDMSSGAALVAAGGFLLGALQKEWFPKPATLGAVPEGEQSEPQRKETD
jgi:hypothetical protein